MVKKLKFVRCGKSDWSVGIPSYCDSFEAIIQPNKIQLKPYKLDGYRAKPLREKFADIDYPINSEDLTKWENERLIEEVKDIIGLDEPMEHLYTEESYKEEQRVRLEMEREFEQDMEQEMLKKNKKKRK